LNTKHKQREHPQFKLLLNKFNIKLIKIYFEQFKFFCLFLGADSELPECDTEISGADDLSDLTRVQNQLPLQRQHSSSLPPGKSN